MRTYFKLDLYKVLGATEELSDAMKRLLTSKDTASMREALADMQKHMFDGMERERKLREQEEAEEQKRSGAADIETDTAPEAGKDEAASAEKNEAEAVSKDGAAAEIDDAAAEDEQFENRPITPQELDDVMAGVRPYRSITVTLDKGTMVIRSVSDDPVDDYEIEYPEQLTNEFLIQTELLDIRKWDPMHYSQAYAGKELCRWELDYNGLKGGEVVKSGFGTFPKGWPVLIDLIDAFGDKDDMAQKSVHVAAGYATSLFAGDRKPGAVRKPGYSIAKALDEPDFYDAEERAVQYSDSRLVLLIDMVHLLSVMRLPEDVVAAGIVRAAALEHGYDEAEIKVGFEGTVAGLLKEYGDDWDLPEAERRIALIEKVKNSENIYFKKLVLAEVMSMLIRVQAELDAGEEFYDTAMTFEEMGLYFAEIIAALSDLEKDERAGALYGVLVDTYKSVFVSYSLDSIHGAIYQMHGNTAGVMLKRGEYDWKPVTGDVPKGVCSVTKELALFLADLWRKQADEAIVNGGNRDRLGDVPDLKALKVVMQKTKGKKTRKDNKVALSVIKRMVDEGEQVLAALHAGENELKLIERGDIDDVSRIAVSFLGLEDDEGNKMAAVFTSMDEIGEIGEDDIEAVPLSTLLRFVKHMDRLDGIIIDPFSDRFLVTKEKVAEMLDDISSGPVGM